MRKLLLVRRIDEHTGFRRDEFGRSADSRRDDGPTARHRLEHGLPERLDQARLADDVCSRDSTRHLVV